VKDPLRLEGFGRYDPGGPDADVRIAPVERVLEPGAMIDEIRAAIDGTRLRTLAVEPPMVRVDALTR
jgi:hypothetical protein